MYKLYVNSVNNEVEIICPVGQNVYINASYSTDARYLQFIQDVAEQGIEIVEGPDIIEPDYATLRQQEYPSREEQLDMMYWDKVNGTTIWEDTIQSIKDKYPKTITGGTTIGEVPAWVQEAADNWTFNKQLREYVAAVERLEHYVLSEGYPKSCTSQTPTFAVTESYYTVWIFFAQMQVMIIAKMSICIVNKHCCIRISF